MEASGLPVIRATLCKGFAQEDLSRTSCHPLRHRSPTESSVWTQTEKVMSGLGALSNSLEKMTANSFFRRSRMLMRYTTYTPSHMMPAATCGLRCGTTRAEECCVCGTANGRISEVECICLNIGVGSCTEIRKGGSGWDSRMEKSRSMKARSSAFTRRRMACRSAEYSQ